MQSVADRRTFVRQMVVGLPVIAGATSLPRSARGFALHDGGTLAPTVESTVRDLARLHNEMRRRGVTAADFHALAERSRALAMYQLQSNRDTELVREIRQVIAREGRQTVIDHQPDPDVMRRELVAFGFDLPPMPPSVVSPERRADALDRLARGGLTPAYVDSTFGFDDLGLGFVISGAGDICNAIKDMQHTVEPVAAVMCTLALMFPPAVPECFAASSVLASLKLLALLLGC